MLSKHYTYRGAGNGHSPEATVCWNEKDPDEAQSIALLFHGGAFVVGSRFMIPSEQIRDLSDAGFVVVLADYSLCPQVSLYDGPIQDARDVYHWCKKTLPGLLAEEGIKVEPAKTVAVGYSAGATLALCLGVEAEPPVAILDFYGPKFFLDSFWSSPLPALAQIPDFDESFINQIFNEPLLTSTATSLEKAGANSPGDGHSAPPSMGSKKPRPEPGMPKPDLSIPRNAWLFSALKHGTHLDKIIQDGNFDRVDPANGFSAKFPPTFFIHGAADALVLTRLSEQAYQKLKDLGVDTGLALVPDASHGFVAGLPEDDPKYAFVREGITFLKNHV